MEARIEGPRWELRRGSAAYPGALERASKPPGILYVVGDPDALQEGLAIVGARKATPYGLGCARRFSRLAAQEGVCVISGGARGCDAAAHEGALAAGGRTVAFLGGGCDRIYPAEHAGLFQRIVDGGGALASEHGWGVEPRPWMFRARNRLIASLAAATLIVEAGLPSGTFSTADEALAASREVLVVPGAITAATSRGANRLLFQGATPIVDDESFGDVLLSLFGRLKRQDAAAEGSTGPIPRGGQGAPMGGTDSFARALAAEPIDMEGLLSLARERCGDADPRSWLAARLAEVEASGLAARYPDGRWGPVV